MYAICVYVQDSTQYAYCKYVYTHFPYYFVDLICSLDYVLLGGAIMNETRMKNAISANIAYYRKRAGYTQSDLAASLGVKVTTVSTWERGRSLPDADTLFSICELFHVSLSDMYGQDSGLSAYSLSYEEREIIDAYRSADPFDRALVRRALGLQEKEAAASSVS